ncbi:MAG TPA: hypothetical protein VNM22_20455 [Candidatus Limnocylindrales bacterium]|nr:hypothetical protein [Candidatus Limnocylindrales bacterium]
MGVRLKKAGIYAGFLFLGTFFLNPPISGYPKGPVQYVTNAGPFCASCHSVADPEYLRDLPPEKIPEQLIEYKHYKAIRDGKGPYEQVSPEDRARLLEDVRMVDINAKVSLQAPPSAKPGETIKVMVTTQGGAGPVIGIMLVDINLRDQASPVSATGWEILEAPQVIGPDGKSQTWWLEKRLPELKRNINFILVNGIKSDLAEKKFPEARVIYTLKAPQTPGEYTLTAAFLYGTEKASQIGLKGGILGPSGRILFSEVIKVRVE